MSELLDALEVAAQLGDLGDRLVPFGSDEDAAVVGAPLGGWVVGGHGGLPCSNICSDPMEVR